MAKNLKLRIQSLNEWMAQHKLPKKRTPIVESNKVTDYEK